MSLDPLQYCKCVPDSQIFDTFCAPPLREDGDRCESFEQCISGACVAGVCITPRIAEIVKGEDGATCESNDQCISDVCDAGTCLTP